MKFGFHLMREFILAVVMFVLAILVAALRAYFRIRKRQFSLLSDASCIVSIILYSVFTGAILYYMNHMSHNGEYLPVDLINGPSPKGPHNAAAAAAILEEMKKMIYTVQVIFTFDISVVKLSILALFWTTFAVDQANRRAIIGVAVMCAVWCIAFTCLVAFRCSPVSYAWQMEGAGSSKCLSVSHVFIPLEVTNIVIDLAILCIPVFAINKLQLSTVKKLSVGAVFAVGIVVCAASVVRIVAIARNHDTEIFFWSVFQLGMAIICSCLPTLGPLFTCGRKRNASATAQRYEYFNSGATGGSSRFKTPSTSGNARTTWSNQQSTNQSTRVWVGGSGNDSESEIPLEPTPVLASRYHTGKV